MGIVISVEHGNGEPHPPFSISYKDGMDNRRIPAIIKVPIEGEKIVIGYIRQQIEFSDPKTPPQELANLPYNLEKKYSAIYKEEFGERNLSLPRPQDYRIDLFIADPDNQDATPEYCGFCYLRRTTSEEVKAILNNKGRLDEKSYPPSLSKVMDNEFYLTTQREWSDLRNSEIFQLKRVAINPEARGGGFGRALVAMAETLASSLTDSPKFTILAFARAGTILSKQERKTHDSSQKDKGQVLPFYLKLGFFFMTTVDSSTDKIQALITSEPPYANCLIGITFRKRHTGKAPTVD